jgi:hypothetical protein
MPKPSFEWALSTVHVACENAVAANTSADARRVILFIIAFNCCFKYNNC